MELDELHVRHTAACTPGGSNAVARGGVGWCTGYTLPAPPVARMVCGARKVTTSSVSLSSAYRPRQRLPGNPSLRVVIRSHQRVLLKQGDAGVLRTTSISVRCTAAPASVTWAMRRALAFARQVQLVAFQREGHAQAAQPGDGLGAFSTTKRVVAGSHRPAPATSVSSMCAAKLSSSASTAAMPPWAQPLEPSCSVRLVMTATRCGRQVQVQPRGLQAAAYDEYVEVVGCHGLRVPETG